MHIGVLLILYVSLCEGVRSPGTGVRDSCELQCGCCALNLGHLEEQLVLLTAGMEKKLSGLVTFRKHLSRMFEFRGNC